MRTRICSLLGLLVASAPAFSFAPAVDEDCIGCFGNTATAQDAGGGCPGVVSITVLITNGPCLLVTPQPPLLPYCSGTPCQGTVTRSWENLPPNEDLDFCSKSPGGIRRCVKPPPTTGSGTDEVVENVSLNCQAGSWTVEIGSACGLSATASAVCSACE